MHFRIWTHFINNLSWKTSDRYFLDQSFFTQWIFPQTFSIYQKIRFIAMHLVSYFILYFHYFFINYSPGSLLYSTQPISCHIRSCLNCRQIGETNTFDRIGSIHGCIYGRHGNLFLYGRK